LGYEVELPLGRQIRLDPIRAVVEAAMEKFQQHEAAKSDPWLGPRLHATLRLTRREAADKRIWEWLTVAAFPDYVRWRWLNPERSEEEVPLDRFFGEDSKNAFARLWWAAEQTRDGNDYRRSVVALGISRFFVSWLHLILIHHRPAALAVVDFLSGFQGRGASDPQGQAMAKAVNAALRTVCLDDLAPNPPTDAEALREWIEEKIDETTMMDELPLGPDEAKVPPDAIAAVRKFLDDLASRIGLASVKTERPSRSAAKAS
jgi:hypothetical protein